MKYNIIYAKYDVGNVLPCNLLYKVISCLSVTVENFRWNIKNILGLI